VDVQEYDWGLDYTDLAQDRDNGQALEYTVMNGGDP